MLCSKLLHGVSVAWDGREFNEAFHQLATRIGLFVSLPLDKLDRLSLQNKLGNIGTG